MGINEIVGAVLALGLAFAGGMVSLALNHPDVQERLAIWLSWALAATTTPALIALHFYTEGMKTAASLLSGDALEAVKSDVQMSNSAMAAIFGLILYYTLLLSFCSWLRSIKRNTGPK